jgi:sigma-70-like protein
LVTGTRLVPLDLRRARGARGRLKETLIDGPGNGAERPHRLQDFSSAMDRQAVGEALNALPLQQREVVKLAYFGGMTNREIADRLGVPVGGVRHRLRQALATAGDYVERGRATGRKVVCVLVAWLCGRSFESTQRTSGAAAEHILRASMVVAAGVTASAVLGLAHSPVLRTPIQPPIQPSVKAAIPSAAAKIVQTPVVSDAVNQVSDVPAMPVRVSVPSPPINLPVPVSVPTGVSLAIPISVPIPVPLPVPTPTVPPLP